MVQRTWWRRGIENYRLRGECRKMQSPVNDKPAITACEKKEDEDEVMGGVCIAIECIQHADRVFVPSWNICSARPPSLLEVSLSLSASTSSSELA